MVSTLPFLLLYFLLFSGSPALPQKVLSFFIFSCHLSRNQLLGFSLGRAAIGISEGTARSVTRVLVIKSGGRERKGLDGRKNYLFLLISNIKVFRRITKDREVQRGSLHLPFPFTAGKFKRRIFIYN